MKGILTANLCDGTSFIFDKEHNKSLWQMSRVKISQNKASELYLSTVLKVNSAIFTQARVCLRKRNAGRLGEKSAAT
jgi:hypothetical protein